MSHHLRARARSALLLALAPLLARAEEAQPPTFTADEVVVRLPRAEAAEDATAAATVVEASRFAGEAKTVAELVTTAPGVAVNQYGGLGQLATVSIRGSTADQVQVFLDGVPLNTAAGGGVDLSRIPRAWIDRIEVVRGAEGAVYGPGAVGGAVNIVTRPAAAGAWSAEATAGSFRTFGGSADLAVGGARWGLLGAAAVDDTSGRFTYLFDPLPALSGNALDSRVRDHNASLTAGALAKLWAGLGAGRLDAILQLSGGARDLPGSPFHLTPDDGQHDFRAGLTTRFAHPLADGLHLAIDLEGLDDHLAVRIAPHPEARQRDLEARASAALSWMAGPSTLTLRAGGAARRLDVDGAVARSRAGVWLAISDDLLLAAGRLRLGPALRWDVEGPFSGASAKLGATLRVAGPLSARANAGRSFRVPSFAELYLQQGLLDPNPALVPEQSWSADAGLVADGSLGLATVAVFTQLYDDLIVYEADSFRRMKPFNDGKAAVRGLEAEVASAPLGPAAIVASAAYTFLASETLRGEEAVLGKSLPHRARHRVFARLGAGHGPFEVHGEGQVVSSQFLDRRNSPALAIPAALTFNAGASVRVWRHPATHLNVDIRNLLDDRSLQDGFGNPLPGRMVIFTLRVSGGKDASTP